MMRSRSLAAIVATTLVLVTTAVLVAYSVISYREEAARQRSSLTGILRLHATESGVALALPVWNIDRPQIDRVVQAMARPKSLYGIRVNASGELHGLRRDANWNMVPWDGKHVPEGLLTEHAAITLSDKVLGSVDVYATQRFLEVDLSTLRMRMITSIAAIDMLLILVIYFLLYRIVVLPLKEIEQAAMAMSIGSDAPPSSTPAAELVNLRTSLETMIRLLDQRYMELQQEVVHHAESEERFRTIYDSVNDAIFIHDSETGAILDVNARMCEMFGYTQDEARQLDMDALSSGTEGFTGGNAVASIRSAQPGSRKLFEWKTRHKDGHQFWVEINMRAATINGTRRVLVVARDITERHEMDETLRRNETMSKMGSLVAGVAHEVRNPLFGIAATIDAFEAEFGSGEGRAEYMSTLRNDVARLTRLMHDLLEYGRPQKLVRHMQPIVPVIAEAVRVCTPRARERQIEIKQVVDGSLPFVAIDADRMLQVFRNVVENAVEFSPAGSSLAIGVRAERSGTSSLVITINDRGPGFNRDDLPHLFEPFFTRRPGGSGLGLAIVQKIVTDHGGTVEARNASEGGGVIEIRLPISS